MRNASLTIGRLSKATATKVETIRYYERIGLLPAPARSEGNYRLYTEEHRKRLAFIRKGRALGFTIEQVRALLRLTDQREQSCAEVDRLAADHVQAIDHKIADLAALGDELRRLIAQCGVEKSPNVVSLKHSRPNRNTSRSCRRRCFGMYGCGQTGPRCRVGTVALLVSLSRRSVPCGRAACRSPAAGDRRGIPTIEANPPGTQNGQCAL